jgi:RimJ/RimL family protein N-acetyltransferase
MNRPSFVAPDHPPSSLNPLSLGWRTDLIFARFDGEVIERDGYRVVRTPTNPGFWWGNFLLFDAAPRVGDAPHWLERFDVEIAQRQPASRHVAFGVNAAQPFDFPDDFAAAGFACYEAKVLTLTRARQRPPRKSLDAARFHVQALVLPDQDALAVDLHVASDAGEHQPVADYRLFRERQMARYGAMERAGLGHWFGVFTLDGRLVADCGLFVDETRTLGRFQHVSTHPAFRRRGLCTALIHAVCAHGFDAMGLDTLVIVADPTDVAIGLYEAVGFERGASSWQLERAPPSDAP